MERLCKAIVGILCTVLATTSEEGCDCNVKGTNKIPQDAAWDGTFELIRRDWIGWDRFGWTGLNVFVFFGMEKAE